MTIESVWLGIDVILVSWLTAGAMAVRSVSRIWLRHWAERRLRGASAAVGYLERPHRLVLSGSVGTAAVLVSAGVVLATQYAGSALVVALLVYAAVMVSVGQMIPRAVARRWAPVLVPMLVPVLRAMEVVASPLIGLGRRLAGPFDRSRARGQDIERDGIQDLLREGELEGVGEHDEIAIITGVVEFGEKHVVEMMTSRADVFALEETTDANALAQRIAQSAYSRVPVYRKTIDNILGMVLAFDVLKAGPGALPPVRPVAFAPPEARCNDLLFRMLRERVHLAVVRDASGRTLGLVSLEDLLEELVGDIRDEHDEPDSAGTARSS